MGTLNILIPSYDEYENLVTLVPEIIKSLEGKVDYTLFVIDRVKGCKRTKGLENLSNRIKVVSRAPCDFYGDAVRTGIQIAFADFVLFMDADGSHDPKFILELWKERDNADIVIASRYTKGGSSFNGPLLRSMSFLVNFSYRVVLNIPVKDVSNSFKLYRAVFIKPLALSSNNFDIIEEIIHNSLRANKGLKMKEIPYHFKERLHGESKRDLVKFSISFFVTLFNLRFRKK